MSLEEKNMPDFVAQIKNAVDQNSPKSIGSRAFKDFGLFNKDCIYVFDFATNKKIYTSGFEKV